MEVKDIFGNVVMIGQEFLWLKGGIRVTVDDVSLDKDGKGKLTIRVDLPFDGAPGKDAILGEFVRIVTPESDAAINNLLSMKARG